MKNYKRNRHLALINYQSPPSTSGLPHVASATLLCGLDALTDIALLADNSPINTFADTYGEGHPFTQTGSARPTKHTVDGYPAVLFDPTIAPDYFPQWMIGDNFADGLGSFAVFIVTKSNPSGFGVGNIITKGYDLNVGSGWSIFSSSVPLNTDSGVFLITDGSNYVSKNIASAIVPSKIITSFDVVSYAVGGIKVYFNGSNVGESLRNLGNVTSISNSEPVRLGGDGWNVDNFQTSDFYLFSGLIYQITDPVNWATDRARINAWSAFRYGILFSAEVGLIANNIIVVQFVGDAAAGNFATGMVFSVNASPVGIVSAVRQSDHSIIYYTIDAAVILGNLVTMDYGAGNIVSETTGESTPLGIIVGGTVKNNVA